MVCLNHLLNSTVGADYFIHNLQQELRSWRFAHQKHARSKRVSSKKHAYFVRVSD